MRISVGCLSGRRPGGGGFGRLADLFRHSPGWELTEWEFLRPGDGNTGLSVVPVPAFSPTVHADVRGGGTQIHLPVIRFESGSRFLRHGEVVGIG